MPQTTGTRTLIFKSGRPLDSVAARLLLPAETSGAILRILGRNTFWLWIDLGVLRIGTMLAGLFLIRYFGPTNFGVYSTALASGWIANSVVDIGLTRYAARAVAATLDRASADSRSQLFHNG